MFGVRWAVSGGLGTGNGVLQRDRGTLEEATEEALELMEAGKERVAVVDGWGRTVAVFAQEGVQWDRSPRITVDPRFQATRAWIADNPALS